MALPSPVVLKYYLYKSTKAVGFYRPVLFLFLLAKGLTFTQITILEALYGATTMVMEVPTGYVGDRIGRRNSLLVGTALIAGSLVAIGLSSSFAVLALLWIVWSLGYNFRSGSDDAWLYDVLVERFDAEQFAHVRGRGTAAGLAVGALGSVVGGYLAEISLSIPFFVAAVLTGLGFLVLLTLPETDEQERSTDDPLTFQQALAIVRTAITNRALRSFILYYFVVFMIAIEIIIVYIQPVTEDVVVGLVPAATIEPLLGWMYAAFALLAAVISYNTSWIERNVGIERWFLAVPLLVGGGLLAGLVHPLLVIPTVVFARSVFDTGHSLAITYVNENVQSVGRATVISAMAMVSSVAVIPAQILSGVFSDAYSPLATLLVVGAFLVVGSVAILAWDSPVKTDASRPVDPSD